MDTMQNEVDLQKEVRKLWIMFKKRLELSLMLILFQLDLEENDFEDQTKTTTPKEIPRLKKNGKLYSWQNVTGSILASVVTKIWPVSF